MREFKNNLPKSVIPVLLTILGTLAFQSLSLLLHFAVERGPVVQQAHFERDRDMALEKNATILLQVIVGMDIREHLRVVSNFEDSLPVADDAKRKHYRQTILDAIDETESELGTLEGYTAIESTVPKDYLTSAIELHSAELEVLETALPCVEEPYRAQATRNCLESIRHYMTRLERTLNHVQSASLAFDANKPMIEAERTLRWDKASHNVDVQYLKFVGALLGLFISFWAYERLFSYFLATEKSELRS